MTDTCGPEYYVPALCTPTSGLDEEELAIRGLDLLLGTEVEFATPCLNALSTPISLGRALSVWLRS